MLWNSLHEQLRQPDVTFKQFKQSLKTFVWLVGPRRPVSERQGCWLEILLTYLLTLLPDPVTNIKTSTVWYGTSQRRGPMAWELANRFCGQQLFSLQMCYPAAGFNLTRRQLSTPSHFCTEQGHCRVCHKRWGQTDSDLCYCGEIQTMSHTVNICHCATTVVWRHRTEQTLTGWSGWTNGVCAHNCNILK